MSIDYEKVEGFKALEPKEAKQALAAYALDTFEVKLNRQKSFENMLVDLEAAVPAEKEPELLIDSPEPEITVVDATADFANYVKEVAPEVADETMIVTAEGSKTITEFVKELEEEHKAVETPVSDSKPVSGRPAWLDGFVPTIFLVGRSARSNGFYTCPYWIYDWIKQNPDTWYVDPDHDCPHYAARSTVKSLAFFAFRDGSVTIRETRNSSFVHLEVK